MRTLLRKLILWALAGVNQRHDPSDLDRLASEQAGHYRA